MLPAPSLTMRPSISSSSSATGYKVMTISLRHESVIADDAASVVVVGDGDMGGRETRRACSNPFPLPVAS